MNKYIGDELDKRLQSCKAKSPSVVDAKETTSVIDLVIKAYMDENPNRSHAPMYRSFRSHAISQIRLFLFAGPCRVGAHSCVWVMLPVIYLRNALLEGYTVELLKVADEHAMHIDAKMLPDGEGLLRYKPERVSEAALRKHKLFEDWDLHAYPYFPKPRENPPRYMTSGCC